MRSVPLSNGDTDVSVDGTIIELDSNVDVRRAIGDGKPPSGVRDLLTDPPEDLVAVVKDGRVTEKTWGLLEPVPAQERTTSGKRYVGGWWIEGDERHFACVGDSGSIVCDADNMAVGMAVAINNPRDGEPHLTFCHAIVPILRSLEVELP